MSALVALVVALVVIVGEGGAKAPRRSADLIFLFGSRERLAALSEAESVEAFRVVSHEDSAFVREQAGLPPAQKGVARFAGYEVIARQAKVAPALARKLEADLRDVLTYEEPMECPPGHGCGSMKLCGGFHPGVGLRFTSGKHPVPLEVLLCFDCDDVGVVHGRNQSVAADSWSDADLRKSPYEIRIEDMSPGRKRLLRLIKRIFPDDAKLQELKETEPDTEEQAN